MTYEKPEATLLGDATQVIQGSKIDNPDAVGSPGTAMFEQAD